MPLPMPEFLFTANNSIELPQKKHWSSIESSQSFFSHTHSSSEPVLGIHLFTSSFVTISLLNSTYSHPLCIPEPCFVAENLLYLVRMMIPLGGIYWLILYFISFLKVQEKAALFSSCLIIHLCSVCHPLKPGVLELLTWVWLVNMINCIFSCLKLWSAWQSDEEDYKK